MKTVSVSTTLLVALACIIGAGIAVLIVNYWNVKTICPEDNVSAAELESYIAALEHRLTWAEIQVSKSTVNIERMVQYIQSRTVLLEKGELELLYRTAQDEAIRLALILSSQPAPTFPGVPLDYKSPRAESFQFDDFEYQDRKDKFTDDRFGYGGEYFEYQAAGRGGRGGGNSSEEAAGWMDDFVGFRDDKDGTVLRDSLSSEVHLSDIEATKLCNDWKGNYSVVPGVSWGELPFDLQQKWLHYSCDYHLADSGKAIITPDEVNAAKDRPVSEPSAPLDTL